MVDESRIAKGYADINDILHTLYIKLYKKIRNNEAYVPRPTEENNIKISFTQLIEYMANIPAIERYYNSNIKPENSVILSQNKQPYDDYNIELAQEINFYMRLIGYYLALKGVPIPSINNARTLNARIDLIDEIDRLYLVVFLVTVPEKNYIGEYITVNYEIITLKNQPVNDGIIEVFYNNARVTKINVGEPLRFQPIETGRTNYTFVFSQSARHKATRVVKNILVVDKNVVDSIYFLTASDIDDPTTIWQDKNGNIESVEGDSLFIPYISYDSESPKYIITDITLDTDSESDTEGDLFIDYEEYEEVYLGLMEEGVTSIAWQKDAMNNPYLEVLSIGEDTTQEPSP